MVMVHPLPSAPFSRNGETDWRSADNTHCKSGYVVIMQTDTRAFQDLQANWPDEPGQVHGIIYRKAFGESCKDMKVVGEGIGIMNGKFKSDFQKFIVHGYSAVCLLLQALPRRFVTFLRN